MSKPTAIGPQSRTVIGDSGAPSVAAVLKPKKPFEWKRLLVPAGIAGAVYLALKYKGHV